MPFGPCRAWVLAAACAAAPAARALPAYEEDPIAYSAGRPSNAMESVLAEVAAGRLRWDGGERAVLRGLLAALGVPESSQVLVFSRTSLQADRIGPATPRALYFSDTCYVGWVPGGLLEVAVVDARLGPVFYRVNPWALIRSGGGPFAVRDADCMRCHGDTFTRGIPGVFARTVFTDDTGRPLLERGTEVLGPDTPLSRRWGGWYVTGGGEPFAHRGNRTGWFADGELSPLPATLAGRLDTAAYLRATSDVVALLVLERQMVVQNALTSAEFGARRALHLRRAVNGMLRLAPDALPRDSDTWRVVDAHARDVVDALLGRGEAELPPGGVEGGPEFARAYEGAGPAAAGGRSLRELQLLTRLHKYRCSTLVYSPFFRALSPPLRERVRARLGEALVGADPGGRYAHLGAPERARIASILRETEPALCAGW